MILKNVFSLLNEREGLPYGSSFHVIEEGKYGIFCNIKYL